MNLHRLILLFALFYFSFENNFKTEASLSTTSIMKARRTQSMRPLTSHKVENNLNIQTRGESLSSSASDTSLIEIKPTDPQPLPSTSSQQQISTTRLQEADFHPLIKKPKHVSIVIPPNLNEASASTHSNGQINPARDGVYARVRNAFLQFGAAAVVGTAIGAGGAAIGQSLMQRNYSVALSNSTNTSALLSVDEIKPL